MMIAVIALAGRVGSVPCSRALFDSYWTNALWAVGAGWPCLTHLGLTGMM
jgi:hypothetical protein